jgi:hypothetical protein
MLTKGTMITKLKQAGIRHGDKNGMRVPLEHLKTYAVTKLYYEYCVN